MPSPTEVSDAIIDGLNEHYGYLDSEVIAADDGNLLVALYYEDGDRYILRIEPTDRHGGAEASAEGDAETTEQRAYREGRVSFYIEKGLAEDNPYVEGTAAHDCWHGGYSAAHAEFCRESV